MIGSGDTSGIARRMAVASIRRLCDSTARLWHLPVCALLLGDLVDAAEMEVRIELPSMQLMLPPVSPPQLQQEGANLPSEQILIAEELLPLIGRGNHEEALTMLRARREWLVTLVESDAPEAELRQLAVPGGFNFGPGSGLVSSMLLYLTGHIYFALEQFGPAENAFEAALVVLPDYVRVHEALGLLYLRIERYEEARVHLARAASLGLNTASLYGALGYVNHQTQNFWGAASAFQQALVMEHDNGNWQRGLLHALTETDQHQAGRALVEQMLQQEPDNPDLWVYRSHLSLLADRPALALASVETAIRLGDDSVANLQASAALHMQSGSIARAVELLTSAFGQGLEFQFVDQALAWLVQKDEWDDLETLLAAVGASRESLTEPEQSRLLTREASLYRQGGEMQQATAALEQAVDLDPVNGEALTALARLYQDQDDYNRAELLFQRASAFDLYRENALLSLAQIAIDQENFARALELLRGVLNENPSRTDLQRNIDSLENLVLLQADD
jgi:tetratricopeptide (TPR) repeat protein